MWGHMTHVIIKDKNISISTDISVTQFYGYVRIRNISGFFDIKYRQKKNDYKKYDIVDPHFRGSFLLTFSFLQLALARWSNSEMLHDVLRLAGKEPG